MEPIEIRQNKYFHKLNHNKILCSIEKQICLRFQHQPQIAAKIRVATWLHELKLHGLKVGPFIYYLASWASKLPLWHDPLFLIISSAKTFAPTHRVDIRFQHVGKYMMILMSFVDFESCFVTDSTLMDKGIIKWWWHGGEYKRLPLVFLFHTWMIIELYTSTILWCDSIPE